MKLSSALTAFISVTALTTSLCFGALQNTKVRSYQHCDEELICCCLGLAATAIELYNLPPIPKPACTVPGHDPLFTQALLPCGCGMLAAASCTFAKECSCYKSPYEHKSSLTALLLCYVDTESEDDRTDAHEE